MPVRDVRRPTAADLDRAWEQVRSRLAPTPVVGTDLLPGAVLKLETAQPTGSFKVRGALAALSALPAGTRAVTPSAGNHGLGVAFAAGALGAAATVVVADTASPAKVDALARRPVDLVRHGDSYDEAEAHALRLAADGGVFVSGYNDPHVIAGGATIGRELDGQLAGPLTVVTPLGGGGLSCGLALWAARRPDTEVVCVEAAASRAGSSSAERGEVVPVEVGPTLADGLAGNLEAGSVTAGLLHDLAPRMLAVTESEIVAAIRWLFREHGLVVEGSGAVGVAAALAGRLPVSGRAVFVLTGRNIDARTYSDLIR